MINKVYILSGQNDYEGENILSIFLNKEKAESIKDKLILWRESRHPNPTFYLDWINSCPIEYANYHNYYVTEWDIIE